MVHSLIYVEVIFGTVNRIQNYICNENRKGEQEK